MYRNLNIRNYIREHMPLYIFVSVLFLMGVVFGAMLVNALSLEQKQELDLFLGSFLHTFNQEIDGQGWTFFRQAAGLHVKWILLIWVLGMSVIGLPLVLVLDFLKGVLVGFTVGFMVGQLSWKGMLFALVSVAPQNLVLVPVIIIASVSAVSFSHYIIRNRFLQRRGELLPVFGSYSMTVLVLAVCAILVSLFEAYVTPVMIDWVSPVLLSSP